MPSTPQPIALRPLTAADVADGDMRETPNWSANFPLDVYLRVEHGGEAFYTPATLSAVKPYDVYASGMADGTPDRHRYRQTSTVPVVGQFFEVTACSERGDERTITLYSTPEAFDVRHPEGDPHRNEVLARRARDAGRIAVPGDGGPNDFDARLVPVYGSEVNLRLIAPDIDPDTLLAEVQALLADKGHIVRAQARSVDDLRVNVTLTRRDDSTDYQPVAEVVAVNVLEAQVVEFMRDGRSVSTTQVRYGSPNIVIGP